MPLAREVSDFTAIAIVLVFLTATTLGRHALSTTAQAPSPVVVQNCGVVTSLARPPARVVTLNQAATEVMLVLGLQNHLVGTAYLDDQILPELADAYRQIPVLAATYPSREILLAARPDLLYAAYPGAFGPSGIGSRADWKARSVETYLSPAGCIDKSPSTWHHAGHHLRGDTRGRTDVRRR